MIVTAATEPSLLFSLPPPFPRCCPSTLVPASPNPYTNNIHPQVFPRGRSQGLSISLSFNTRILVVFGGILVRIIIVSLK